MLSAVRPRLATRVPRINNRVCCLSTATPPQTLKIKTIPAPHNSSIKIISLNRPEARNAISQQLLSELRHEIEILHAEKKKKETSSETTTTPPTRALILSSEIDTCFCAGADLKERLSYTPAQTKSFLTELRATFTRLARLHIPTISAVGSTALGGGLELALATHFRVFASTAVVGLPETRLGIIPGAGGTWRLPRLVGPSRARDLILTGRRVRGPDALFLGLCDRLVEVELLTSSEPGRVREKVLEHAVEFATGVCEGAPVAISAALEALEHSAEGQEAENRAYERVLGTEDRIEALKAFAEKRKPVYHGR